MVMTVAIALLVVAAALLLEADRKRAAWPLFQSSAAMRRSARWGGGALAAASLWLSAYPQGWERGIAVWLGLVTLAGVGVLLWSSWKPGRHWHAAYAACSVSFVVVLSGLAGLTL